MSGKDWPPCPLCFKAATPEEVEMARGQLDVDAIEQTMMETAEHHTGRRGMTTVAFAIGGLSDCRSLATRRGGSLLGGYETPLGRAAGTWVRWTVRPNRRNPIQLRTFRAPSASSRSALYCFPLSGL